MLDTGFEIQRTHSSLVDFPFLHFVTTGIRCTSKYVEGQFNSTITMFCAGKEFMRGPRAEPYFNNYHLAISSQIGYEVSLPEAIGPTLSWIHGGDSKKSLHKITNRQLCLKCHP